MIKLMVRSSTRYRLATPTEVAEAAAEYAANRLCGTAVLANPSSTRDYLRAALIGLPYEVFCCVWLDNRHRVLCMQQMFRGTIDGASVHPREVVRSAIEHHAAAVILVHNHPSGIAEPSQADELITNRIRDALATIDVRVLDHIVVASGGTVSFAERGLI